MRSERSKWRLAMLPRGHMLRLFCRDDNYKETDVDEPTSVSFVIVAEASLEFM